MSESNIIHVGGSGAVRDLRGINASDYYSFDFFIKGNGNVCRILFFLKQNEILTVTLFCSLRLLE